MLIDEPPIDPSSRTKDLWGTGNAPHGLVISAPSSGTGKTLMTLGIIGALRSQGLGVVAAKVGPDYIDPRFHEAASGHACVNLDSWAMSPETVRGRLWAASRDTQVAIVEGVMGLFDGAAGGGGSTAEVAECLGLPVVLVVDASQQAQSIAAVVHGFCSFRPATNVAGVIATKLGSKRHASIIEAALRDSGARYLGAVPNDPQLSVQSRHLGLIQACEHGAMEELLSSVARSISEHVDLEALLDLAQPVSREPSMARLQPLGQRIAIASDPAFAFAYPHLLGDWHANGAELLFFSPLANEAPPSDCDAVFLPGGYPELHAGLLAAATMTRQGLVELAGSDALIYGECGGYMYLGEALVDANGSSHAMSGLLSHVTSFAVRARSLGYRQLRTLGPLPFGEQLRGHEFHYSTLQEPELELPLFDARDAAGAELGKMGGARGNVMGSFAHVIDAVS